MEGGGDVPAHTPFEGGTAGGKFRKRPFRKRPATPYDRPPPPLGASAARQKDGWLSRLADPASRLLARGATRLFPSLFSKTLTDQQMEHEGGEELPEASCLSKIAEAREQRDQHEEDESKIATDNDLVDGDKLSNSYDGSRITEIEQLFKQKTFSRDEFDHLMEVLRSRTTDLPDYDNRGKTGPDMVVLAEAAEGTLQQGNLRKSVEENHAELDYDVMGRTPAPPIKSTIYDEVGASPVDIAKAFMGVRTSALNPTSQSVLSKDERMPPYNDLLASSSPIPSTPLKSPICWPGAMIEEVPGYFTPQTQRGTISLHNLPRTPYNRTVRSGSISKGFGERPFNLQSVHSKQKHTPIFGTSQARKSNALDDGFTLVRPYSQCNKIPQKSMEFATPRVPGSSHSASPGFLPSRSGAFEGFLSSIPENVNNIASKSSSLKLHPSERKAPGLSFSSTVHPHSSVMARRILEHLDRAVPSPKEKANELKLAVSGLSSLPEVSTSMSNGQHRQPDTAPGSFSSSHFHFGNGDTSKVFSHVTEETTKANEVGNMSTTGVLASKTFSQRHEVSAGLTQDERGDKNWPLSYHNTIDERGIEKVVSSAVDFDLPQMPKPRPHSSGNKPSLTSISITKPNGKSAFPPDNISGFSFPVSSASISLSEPPTPTMITPSVSKTTVPKEETTIPSFTFGSTNAPKGPVFSFAPTVSSSVVDTSIPKFNFGSEKKANVSFRSVGKDAICL